MNEGIWERFDENFDACNGGCMYLCKARDHRSPNVALAAGAMWIDGTSGEPQYWAGVSRFYIGEDRYGGTAVNNVWEAASAFPETLNGEIDVDLGMFMTINEAVDAVESYIRANPTVDCGAKCPYCDIENFERVEEGEPRYVGPAWNGANGSKECLQAWDNGAWGSLKISKLMGMEMLEIEERCPQCGRILGGELS